MTGGGGKQWINGETITGIALVLLALLFIWAATMNAVWARILLAAYLILAIGLGFIVLGIITMRRTNRTYSEGHTHNY
jgi:multisubunit Na+/H+ antiporter MnhB subunit